MDDSELQTVMQSLTGKPGSNTRPAFLLIVTRGGVKQ